MTAHQIPLHSGEPRAQHAPRGPDGCLLPSLQPSDPHPPSSIHEHTPTPPAQCTPVSYRVNLSVPPGIYVSLSDEHAQVRANTHTLRYMNCITLTINFTPMTHDLYAVLAWVPHLHALYGSMLTVYN